MFKSDDVSQKSINLLENNVPLVQLQLLIKTSIHYVRLTSAIELLLLKYIINCVIFMEKNNVTCK